MRTRRYCFGMQALAWIGILSVGGLELCQAPCQAMGIHAPKPWHVCELKPGLTQTPDAEQFQKILAHEAALKAGQDSRPLTSSEMKKFWAEAPRPTGYAAMPG